MKTLLKLFLVLFSTITFSQNNATVHNFDHPKLQFSIVLSNGFVTQFENKQSYVEVIFSNPKKYTNGALWSYSKKFHTLKEMLANQENDTSFVQVSKMRTIKIDGMEAYLFEGTEQDENKQNIISNRIVIDRQGFDEFYLVYLNAKSSKEIKQLIQVVKSIKKL